MTKYLLSFCLLFTLLSCARQGQKTYTLPQLDDVVIYQVNPRVFAEKESFNAIGLYLDSIKQLGANIIWFMPIHEIGKEKSVNSPYCVKDYKSVNSEFGTMEDFKKLITQCHDKEIGVIIDWVPNHTSWDNPWIKNTAWYTQDSIGNIISPAGTGWNDVADLNFNNQDMRLAMIDAMKYWIVEVGIDGFRCDAVDFVPADFLQQANDTLRSIPGHKLLMLAEGKREDHFDVGFDLNYAWDFMEAMRDVYLKDSCATALFSANEAEYKAIPKGKRKLRFSTNHDETQKQSPVEEFNSERGSMSAFLVSAYMPGCPMIYSSQEVGYPKAINFFRYTPVDWSANNRLRKEYERIFQIYNINEALRKGDLKTYPNQNILLFERYTDTEKVIVAINVRNAEQKMELPYDLSNKKFTNLFSGNSMTLGNTMILKPYEYLILK
ncbi:alpha-amylase family glycosyl hydrolase [Dysgonomonas sp. ZJ279]|uniref:alpha-amylase family glycosyl hydrolase n=1 Tax=Dysgonomonas sp. ZJ279 TaxID=2709796 RepID=UPI0013EA4793|nr:alpha-amylase family glycosyl hydrolase [Dysgonomonas sp. ZJ279]